MSVAVIDIGKTNLRVAVVDPGGKALALRSRPNAVVDAPPYPHFDSDGLERWILASLGELSREHEIEAIVPVSHGACAALVRGAELALPVLDYEFEGPQECADYDDAAAHFDETGTPRLPAGLNLGRQLCWLARRFPDDFAAADALLPWPQYWAFRLSGVAAFEATSLGCHTDLWNPWAGSPSAYAERAGLAALLPERVRAWTDLGPVTRAVCEATGLDARCRVIAGIHDSNASFLSHRASRTQPFAVVSTGTWFVAMGHAGAAADLREDRDTLVGVDAFGDPVPTARFAGGREIAAISDDAAPADGARLGDVVELVEAGALVLPAFSSLGGPFRSRIGSIEGLGDPDPRHRRALAALYAALMTDLCLDFVGAQGEVILEGRFAGDEAFAGCLALLRSGHSVLVSADETGTLAGGALLAGWPEAAPAARLTAVSAPTIAREQIAAHRVAWRSRVAQKSAR